MGGGLLPKLFGTDGVRGIANVELTPELALRLGRVGADLLAAAASTGNASASAGAASRAAKAGRPGRPFLLLGRDSRLSSDLLAAAVTAGACSVGMDVVDLGIVPTPGVAHLVRALGAAGGAMISASHNPVDDNGIKFFDIEGYKLAPEAEEAIEAKLGLRQDRLPRPSGAGVGAALDGRTHVTLYEDHILAAAGGERCLDSAPGPGTEPDGPRPASPHIVIDPAYGATARLASRLLARAGAKVTAINDTWDGSRINVKCGSTNPESLGRKVKAEGAAAGLAFDGDGDRVIACDEKGQIVDGDQIMTILALDFLARKQLNKKTVVATVMSNLGLDLALREAGGKVVRTPVGDRSVLVQMREIGAMLGGEQSGHVILLKHATTGDGLLTGLCLLSVMVRSGQAFSSLADQMKRLPQILVNVSVTKKEGFETSEKVATAIERARESLGHTGRVLVRPSGTEPLVRVMIEGRDLAEIKKMAAELAGVVAAELGGEVLQ